MADPGRIPRITPEDALGAFMDRDDRAEPMTAPEIAEELDCSRRTALNKLHTLEEDGEVTSKKVGGRSKVWWTPIPREESAETGQEPARGDAGGNEKEPEEASLDTERAGAAGDLTPDARDRLPGTDEEREARFQAVGEIYGYLKKEGTAKKSDFEGMIDAEEAGYGGEDPFDSFWNSCITNNGVLTALPGVSLEGKTYTYGTD